MQANRENLKFNNQPVPGMILLGVLAFLVGYLLRAESHRWLNVLRVETLVFSAFPVLAYFFVRRTVRSRSVNPKLLFYGIQAGAFLLLFMVLVAQWISRSFGVGDANEIVALALVQYVSWYLIVFSGFGFRKVAFILVASLVLFVCFIANTAEVFVTAFLFAIIAMWWLLGNYWSRVNGKALDGDSRTLPISSIAIALNLSLVSLIGFVAWLIVPPDSGIFARGFSPFSGGKDGGASEFARSGLGDGNMLTAGANAKSAGAVESEQFIEDDKPSMYDITVEKYNAPKMIKKRRNRAIALNERAKHLHKVIKSEQAGKTFRTLRESNKDDQIKNELEDKITEALFFVEGSVPARFSTDIFDEFDGFDWKKNVVDKEKFPLPKIVFEKRASTKWYSVRRVRREYMSSQRQHRIKIMRLDSNRLPTPSLIQHWHIDRANIPNLFYWNDFGSIEMQGEFIASHTMIDTISQVPNYHVLRSGNLRLENQPNLFWSRVDELLGVGNGFSTERETSFNYWQGDPESQYLQVPDNRTSARMKELVSNWTKDVREGWNQVESIVDRIREDYRLDTSCVASDDCEDTASHFLNVKAGPSYLFATTATQLLRVAGYQTRLVKGFIARQQDFDRVANQSVVASENLHFWPEVCLDGQNWIAVELTPGYPRPYSDSTLWQRLVAFVFSLINWSVQNPFSTTCLIALAVCAVKYRFTWIAAGCWVIWLGASSVFPKRRLRLTRQLIDIRFWAAGIPRPAFETISDWYSQVLQRTDIRFFQLWLESNFSSEGSLRQSKSEVMSACQEIADELSYKKIKTFARIHIQNES